ncbi:unnamed protein product [Owenia fusiformis]|uniref:Chitin-binding type-2 domain-containing protein n=1 Tax=Owenia fusiformis TaxID=6347 RepID=A0A8S4NWH3_OWEFU|nr:unnamed protein product [Owenia fusiformis]
MALQFILTSWLVIFAHGQVDIHFERLEVDPVECLEFNGILPDETRPGGDCCHFIQCDASDANKTGFRFACMYPLVWNRAITACDEESNILGPCIHTTCSISPARRNVCGSDAEIKAIFGIDSCCIEGEDGVYEALQDISPAAYRFRYLNGEYPEDEDDYLSCPKGQIFSADDCCCESDAPSIAECEQELFFKLPGDDCCTYHQCYPNRTSYFDGICVGSVWNQKILNCDNPTFVEGCENAECLTKMTEAVCPLELDTDQCCSSGVVYTKDRSGILGGSTFFIGEIDFDDLTKLLFEQNIGACDEGQVFDLECCCCFGIPAFAPECDCIQFTFEENFTEKDVLQETPIHLDGANVRATQAICGDHALEFNGINAASVDFFRRKPLGEQFTFSFGVDGSQGEIITNGNGETSPTFLVTLNGATNVALTLESGVKISLSGGLGMFVTIVKDGESTKLYIDGMIVDEELAKGQPAFTDSPLKIGTGFVGSFDQLVYCTFAYTDDQVNNLASCNVKIDVQN